MAGPSILSGPSVLLVVEIADFSLDAVQLTARVFRDPAADGYRQIRDFTSSETVTPLVAPSAFALRLDDLPDVADLD